MPHGSDIVVELKEASLPSNEPCLLQPAVTRFLRVNVEVIAIKFVQRDRRLLPDTNFPSILLIRTCKSDGMGAESCDSKHVTPRGK
jgi:hypothetical protein